MGEEIKASISPEKKEKFTESLKNMIHEFEAEYPSIQLIDFIGAKWPLRQIIWDSLPDFFEDGWFPWGSQMQDIWNYYEKKMTAFFFIDRVKNYFMTISAKKQELIKD